MRHALSALILIFIVLPSTASRFNLYEYIKRQDSLSVSDFLRWSDCLADSSGVVNPFRNIPEQIVDNNALMNFFISPKSDTVFFKIEKLHYSNFRKINITENGITYQSKNFYQLLVWTANELIYVDDHGNDLLLLSETNSDILQNEYSDFFQLIEDWNYNEINSHKTDHIDGFSTFVAPSEIYRVIFKGWKVEIEGFEFKNLKFNDKILKKHYNASCFELLYEMNYNAIIEDILFYRHRFGINRSFTPEEKEKRKEMINRQREYRKNHP